MRKALRQRAALAAAIALLLAPLSGSLHLLRVDHSVCAEHGEVVHGEHEHAADLVEHQLPATDGLPPLTAHDHGCGLLANLWSQPLPAQVVTSAPAPGHTMAAIRVLACVLEFEQDVVAYAPKQSPPA